MPAHASLAETQGLEVLLESTDLQEPLGGNRSSIRDAAGEARRRGLIPDGQPQQLSDGTNGCLVEAELDERAAHARMTCGFEPRAIVPEVVIVGAVENVGEAELCDSALRD